MFNFRAWRISTDLCNTLRLNVAKAQYKSNTLNPPQLFWHRLISGQVVGVVNITCYRFMAEVFLVDAQLYQQSIQDSASLILDDDPTTCPQLTRSDLQDTPMTLSFYSDNMVTMNLYSIIGQGLFCYNAQACPPNVVSMTTLHDSDTCTLQYSQQEGDLFTVCKFMCLCSLGCQSVNVTFTVDAIAYTARTLKLCGGSVDDIE